MPHCYWFVLKFSNQSECIYVKYSIQIYIAFIQNGTGSWGLPFLYSYTYIHRNMTGSWGLPSFYISTSTHRIRIGSWGLPSFYIYSSIITNIQRCIAYFRFNGPPCIFLSPLLSFSPFFSPSQKKTPRLKRERAVMETKKSRSSVSSIFQ